MKELVGKKKEQLEPIIEKVSNVIDGFGFKHDIKFDISKRNAIRVSFSNKNHKYDVNETTLNKSYDYIKCLLSSYVNDVNMVRERTGYGDYYHYYHEIRISLKRNSFYKLINTHTDLKDLDSSLQSISKFGL